MIPLHGRGATSSELLRGIAGSPGVGLGMKPNPVFLKVGDVVTLGIEGLGEQRQRVVAFKGRR